MNDKDFSIFENKIGISFKNKDILMRALTHRSFINENRQLGLEHNERLEFLGDAVLELIVTVHLFNAYPDKTEGELTAYRSGLVNTSMLSSVASTLSVNDFVLLSRGEAKDTGRARQYILANTLEAIVGAIYLDQGYEKAQKFIEENILTFRDDVVDKRLWQDAKSRFQESAQEHANTTPSYRVLEEVGPDHDRLFTVGVFLGKDQTAKGEGKSKQEAEQDAARMALEVKNW
jgi:ribonuclease-3|tara:strand:- start:23986 stop:24681 length:696 start_codon:yes stop_codon:yes gene_type:complete